MRAVSWQPISSTMKEDRRQKQYIKTETTPTTEVENMYFEMCLQYVWNATPPQIAPGQARDLPKGPTCNANNFKPLVQTLTPKPFFTRTILNRKRVFQNALILAQVEEGGFANCKTNKLSCQSLSTQGPQDRSNGEKALNSR